MNLPTQSISSGDFPADHGTLMMHVSGGSSSQQVLVDFVRRLCTGADLGPTDIAALSGVSVPTVRRILSGAHFREVETLERACSASGLGLLGRDGNGIFHPILDPRDSVPEGASGEAEAALQVDPECDGLLGTLAGHCRRQGLNPHRLALLADIPYASAYRLMGGRPSRVITTLQRLMAALGARLVAVADDGTCTMVPTMPPNPSLGTARRRAHAECQRRYRQLHPAPASRSHAPGRLLIGKGEVLDLYRRHHLSFAEIGRIAGVSRHRIRQIVAMMANVHHDTVSR